MSLVALKRELKNQENKKQALILSRFFKTGHGEYGEGDKFLGIKVPAQRQVAKKYIGLASEDLQKLLDSLIHEYRLIALIILVIKFNIAPDREREKIFKFYIRNSKNINNWDLVDLSAPNIAGQYLLDKNRAVLRKLARSSNLWKKRIAIIATLTFIRQNDFSDTMEISRILLHDEHDLIRKAVGWMLREVGKRNQAVEESFLKKHYKAMPRTCILEIDNYLFEH